jgi:hypothetical protein
VLRSRSLRLSLFGAAIFLISIVSLIFLPDGPPIVGMIVGGMCVWIGFIWTIFSWYSHPT